MRWEDERYVRLYVRDTTDWAALPWQSRVVFYELIRKVDRAGIFDLGKSGIGGVANILRMPVEVVEAGIAGLIADESVKQVDGALIVVNFIEAQEVRQSDAARKREQRLRDAARAKTTQKEEGESCAMSPVVTSGHTYSPPVTLIRSDPSLDKPNQEKKQTNVGFSETVTPTDAAPSEPSGSGSFLASPDSGPSEQDAPNLGAEPDQEPPPTAPSATRNAPQGFALTSPPVTPPKPASEVFRRYVDGWHRVVKGRNPPKLTEKRERAIKARLAEKFTLDELLDAADGIWRSAWHIENGRTDFDLVFRDAAHVEKFRDVKAGVRSGDSRPLAALQQPTPGYDWKATSRATYAAREAQRKTQ